MPALCRDRRAQSAAGVSAVCGASPSSSSRDCRSELEALRRRSFGVRPGDALPDAGHALSPSPGHGAHPALDPTPFVFRLRFLAAFAVVRPPRCRRRISSVGGVSPDAAHLALRKMNRDSDPLPRVYSRGCVGCLTRIFLSFLFFVVYILPC